MHLITKNKMKIKYIGYFTIFFLTILSLPKVNSNALEIDKNVYAGNKDAKVTIKVFSSLTCPYCADFHKNVFVKLKKDHKKRIALLDEIYAKQEKWASGNDINNINSKLSKIAKKYDLNDDRIKNCLVNENLENEILEIRINGSKKYSIQSTPTIFINEKKYDGKHDYNLFKKEIEKLL